jgi:DNA-binding NarL/FixJ family response regulator
MIRILLADDQTLVRQGIRQLLEVSGDLRVTREVADGEAALEALTPARRAGGNGNSSAGTPPELLGETFDLALLDVRMPKLTGVQVVQRLRKAEGHLPVILLTTFDDDLVLQEGMRAGISGYLLKDVSREKLEQAVRVVAAGGKLIRPAVTERAVRELAAKPPAFPSAELPDPLTPREIEIVRLMAAGLSNGEIAARLGTAEGTVKNHSSHIFSKLGVRDRTRAVLKALELGCI